jgi:two-component system CheB/CheR fusion protein
MPDDMSEPAPAEQSPEFAALLDFLKRSRGFDFNAYKEPSLARRVRKRMQAVGIQRFGDYVDHLEVHPEEFEQLFNAVLINVTAFFRDELAWESMRDTIVPELVQVDDAIRIWTAACASGEETCSIAMLLAEALGLEQFRKRVKIYATDVDEQALAQARAATYTDKQVADVPRALLERYFSREGDRFVFDKELRRAVIFGRHDLIQDAPISRVNLICCRNTLMYFNAEAQSRILARFHFALVNGGVLFLGKAEMLLTHSQLFAPIDLRRRIFRKVSKGGWRDRMAIMNQAGGDPEVESAATHNVYVAAFQAGPDPQVVIDAHGLLGAYNERARLLFALTPADVGRPIQDLELSYRPVELRPHLAQAAENRRPLVVRDLVWDAAGREPRYYDVHIAPSVAQNGRSAAATVTFVDITRTHELQVELQRSKQDLETAYEELQSTNEELETTNEELQSTVEELETTNEELQSTNEELETMNEELQSSNEELQSINDEVRQRSEQVNRANGLFESILAGVQSGVVVLDRDCRVLAWNQRAEDLWGLRANEVTGQNFLNLDIGLPVDGLRGAIRSCVGGERNVTELVVSATNRRGKPVTCRVTVSPLLELGRDIIGTILLMDEPAAAP